MVTPDQPFLSHSPGDLLGDAMAVRETYRVQTGYLAQPAQNGTALGRRVVLGGQEQTLRNQGAPDEPGTLSLRPLQRGSGAMENQEASSPGCQGDMEALIAQGETWLPPGLRFGLFQLAFFLAWFP